MPQVMVLTPLEPFPHLRNDLMIPSFAKFEVGNFFTSQLSWDQAITASNFLMFL